MVPELYLVAPPDVEAAPFAQLLLPMLAIVPVAALLLRRGRRSEADYVAFVREIAPIGQEAGAAVLIEGAPALVAALGADGLHVTGPLEDVAAAMAALKPDLIVGAGDIVSRHDAMSKGELSPDYIMFGPLSGAIAPDIRDLAAWWAQAMVIPSVLSDPEASAASADSAGCEFLAVGDSIWDAADPAATLAAIAEAAGAAR